MSDQYILIGQTPVPEPDLERWALWRESADRKVGDDRIGPYHISTVFLASDHRFGGQGPPLLFETMIFGIDDSDEFQCTRCSTWLEAEEMHRTAVQHCQKLIWKGRTDVTS